MGSSVVTFYEDDVLVLLTMNSTLVRDIYKTLVGIYLLCGLVLLSLTLTVYYDIPQLNLGLHLHRTRCL
jgi:hypothetical protein